MSLPTLTPRQTAPTNILPETGSVDEGHTVANYPYGIYADLGSDLYDGNFVSGAIDQVNYTFRKLGGDVLDIDDEFGPLFPFFNAARNVPIEVHVNVERGC